MGKGVVGKKHVLKYAAEKNPEIAKQPRKPSFKEVKRRTILAGLRVMKAPAVP